MYTAPQKKFHLKPQEQIEAELSNIANSDPSIRRVFLADGDVMTLSFRRLKDIMRAINQYLPDVQRVSSYCLPRNIKNKTVEELRELRSMGLGLVYIGGESGDDEILEKIIKGETYQSSLSALQKTQQAGISRSVMILNGLGGNKYSEQHAINSARLMNDTQPEYLSTLVVSFPLGVERFQDNFGGDFTPLTQIELAQEMEILLSTLQLEKTIFRSDHASNYLILRGTLNKDREKLLQTVRSAISKPGSVPLRQEWQRGL
tara:strand:- start:1313 stop:2092 length:780 start_codon:yes stop_codon:yes gene_type:complete